MHTIRGAKTGSAKKGATASGKQKQQPTPVIRVTATSPENVEMQAYNQLQQAAKIKSCLQLQNFKDVGNGLLATQKKAKDEVLMSVPKGLAIIVDYNEGLQISNGKWPRLRLGATSPEPLPWDLLIALALVDGLAGDGDSFWGPWCQAVLPPPELLTLPMCWSKAKLEQLQHPAIIDAALMQQERLKSLFPDLMETESPDDCSWFQWAFACVRSRALKVNDDIFALVPFLDMANHSSKPNANFRLNSANGAFELFAIEDVEKGDHVTISYSGEPGLTNQRFMAQYGFVPRGNMADRIEFEVPDNMKAGSPAKLLQLTRIQDRFGDAVMMDAASGKNPYLMAAMKSLPFTPEADEAGMSCSSGDEHLELARNLHSQCEAMLQGFPTSIQQDEEILAAADRAEASSSGNGTLGDQAAATSSSAPSEASSSGMSLTDPCYIAAVKYRLERKRLLQACRLVLGVYARGE